MAGAFGRGDDGHAAAHLYEFFGRHFTSVVFTSIIAALGWLGVLTGEATATLLGAVIGYVLGKNGHGAPHPPGEEKHPS